MISSYLTQKTSIALYSMLLLIAIFALNFQVDDSIRKLVTNGRDLDDALLASVIRNLKIVEVVGFFSFKWPLSSWPIRK